MAGDPSTAAELAQVLGDAVAERLAADGWQRIARPFSPMPWIGDFKLPLKNDFAAVASVRWVGPSTIQEPDFTLGVPEDSVIRRIEPDARSLEATVEVGVHFEPLARLMNAIDGRSLIELVSEWIRDLQPAPSSPVVTVTSAVEVPAAADQLVELIATYAVPFAERYATVDALLTVLDDREEFDADEAARLRPALLVAAGRYVQARGALSTLEAHERDEDWEDERERTRLARQLKRFIGAEGALELPRGPARWPPFTGLPPRPEPRSFSERWRQARVETAARRDALDAVRSAGEGKSREQLKAILEWEQRSRGLDVDRLRLEWLADQIEAEREPLGKARMLLRGVRALIEVGRDMSGGIGRALREESEDPPQWLRPPAGAAYPVRSIGQREWAAVELDPGVEEWLTRVADHATRMRPCRMVEVWLDRSKTETPGSGDLDVCIGEQRVGKLRGDVVEVYRPAMDAAAERDELPWTEGRLTRITGTPPYLLEVHLPVVVS